LRWVFGRASHEKALAIVLKFDQPGDDVFGVEKTCLIHNMIIWNYIKSSKVFTIRVVQQKYNCVSCAAVYIVTFLEKAITKLIKGGCGLLFRCERLTANKVGGCPGCNYRSDRPSKVLKNFILIMPCAVTRRLSCQPSKHLLVTGARRSRQPPGQGKEVTDRDASCPLVKRERQQMMLVAGHEEVGRTYSCQRKKVVVVRISADRERRKVLHYHGDLAVR